MTPPARSPSPPNLDVVSLAGRSPVAPAEIVARRMSKIEDEVEGSIDSQPPIDLEAAASSNHAACERERLHSVFLRDRINLRARRLRCRRRRFVELPTREAVLGPAEIPAFPAVAHRSDTEHDERTA